MAIFRATMLEQNVVTVPNNVGPMLQCSVVLKIVVANRPE